MYYFFLFSVLIVSITARAVDKDPNNDEKIVGGEEVSIEDYPYQVSIWLEDNLWCGGSILTENYVLTAAHCILKATNSLVVKSGSSFLVNGGILHNVDSNITYGTDLNHDIGLLHVKEPFVFDRNTQPIEIPAPDTVAAVGTLGIVTGWGKTNEDIQSDQLRAVDVPIVDRSICTNIYKGIFNVHDGQICAGYVDKGGADACQGDSGGPLVMDGKQFGIVSKGYGCAMPNAPGIYTDVPYFTKWISEMLTP